MVFREGFLEGVVIFDKKTIDHSKIFVECMNGQERVSIWWKNTLHKGNRKYEDPELGMTLVHLKTRKKAVELKHSE